jgi:hypothetical protein
MFFTSSGMGAKEIEQIGGSVAATNLHLNLILER